MSEDIQKLDVMKLLQDPALWVALGAILCQSIPVLGDWVDAHRESLYALYMVIAGHFGVRVASVIQKGALLRK